jgi:hypothetical protein
MNRRKSERTQINSIVDVVDGHVHRHHRHHDHQSSFRGVESKVMSFHQETITIIFLWSFHRYPYSHAGQRLPEISTGIKLRLFLIGLTRWFITS